MASMKTKARTAVGVVIALVTGFFGLAGLFSDLASSETIATRMMLVTLIYAVGCGFVGALRPRMWYLALVAAWGPFMIGLLGLVTKLRQGGQYPYWSILFVDLLFVPGAALVFGCGGSWFRRRLSRSHEAPA